MLVCVFLDINQALFRRGMAHKALGRLREAAADFRAVQAVEPHNKRVVTELAALDKTMAEAQAAKQQKKKTKQTTQAAAPPQAPSGAGGNAGASPPPPPNPREVQARRARELAAKAKVRSQLCNRTCCVPLADAFVNSPRVEQAVAAKRISTPNAPRTARELEKQVTALKRHPDVLAQYLKVGVPWRAPTSCGWLNSELPTTACGQGATGQVVSPRH